MFKYLKTAASDYHPAEVVEFLSDEGDTVKKGSFITTDGSIIENEYANCRQLFLAITGKESDKAAKVKCIPVYSNMMFEATICPDEDANSFYRGSACDVLPDDTGKGSYVSMLGAPLFEIVDDSNKENGTVVIRLM